MNKKRLLIVVGLSLFFGGVFLFAHKQEDTTKRLSFTVQYPEGTQGIFFSEKQTVGEALAENGFSVAEKSRVFPSGEALLQSGTIISIEPAKKITFEYDGKKEEQFTPARTVGEALVEQGISVSPEDIVYPQRDSLVSEGSTVEIVRVTVTEEQKEEKIPFKKIEEEDSSVSWQTKKVVQKGEVGIKTTFVQVSRHNDKVVAEKVLKEEITKAPVDEKTVIGTKVTVVKKHNGGASWYAHTGTLAAANPWLPFGSYVRVTNKANGKSVIVKINDRGPFGAGRIIDLDKVAFAKIADIGTGVIDVLMEEIK